MSTTAEKLTLLLNTKADIKAALAEKGQTASDVFSTYADKIRAIETGPNLDSELTTQDTLIEQIQTDLTNKSVAKIAVGDDGSGYIAAVMRGATVAYDSGNVTVTMGDAIVSYDSGNLSIE